MTDVIVGIRVPDSLMAPAATQLVPDYIESDGIPLASKRRAYTRGPNREVNLDPLMVSIDISDVRFS
jgi:hypothetical protein